MGASVAVLVLGGWIGVRGWMAKDALESAQADISVLKKQALAFDVDGATATLDRISKNTATAASLTSDPIWRGAELIPVLGKNLTTVRQLSVLSDDVIADVASPLISVVGTVNPATLIKDSTIDVSVFSSAAPAVKKANTGAQAAVKLLREIDTSGTIPQLGAAHAKIAGLIDQMAPALKTLDSVMPVLPTMLGADGPRSYVVMFENPAEARALGGTSLFFAVVNVDAGHIAMEKVVPAGFANFPRLAEPIVAVPDGVQDVYQGMYGTFIANATVRPDFPSAAGIVAANWNQTFGVEPDGVISIDPVALAYVLRSSSPITLSTGDVIDGKNLVPVLLNQLYQRYNSGDVVADNIAQNAVYAELIQATFTRLTSGALKPTALAGALARSVSEHRLLLWSPDEAIQKQYAELGADGALPKSDDDVARVGLYFQDAVGSKLNYYLRQSVTLAGACSVDGGTARRVSMQLTSTVGDPAALSPSIVGNWENEDVPRGYQRMTVLLYAPPGSSISGATVDGQPYALPALHDTDYPVGRVTVIVPPGGTVSVSYDLVTPGSAKKFEAEITPLVAPTAVESAALDCSQLQAAG